MIAALAFGVALMRDGCMARLARSQASPSSRACLPALHAIPLEAGQDLPEHGLASKFSASGDRLISTESPTPSRNALSTEADPEVRAIQTALRRIEQDPVARQKFYEDLDTLIARVRADRPIPPDLMVDSELPPTPHRDTDSAATPEMTPGDGLPKDVPTGPPDELQSEPRPREPAIQLPPLVSRQIVGPGGKKLDPAVVSRVIYWARQNGCPVQLALATAWRESEMTLHPARGASGEIGIMQILPDRARIEGVDPSRLEDSETNIWLGTKLLAQYYSEEGSVARAAMKYVAGPGVFSKHYSPDMWNYIEWYSSSVSNYADYFGRYVNF